MKCPWCKGSKVIEGEPCPGCVRKKPHKYRAVATEVDGIRFDSKKEAFRYGQLKLLEQAGLIAHLEVHPRYPLTVNGLKVGTYVADFRYAKTDTGELIVEDVKGVRTPVYRLKKKLVRAIFGFEIREV